MKVWVIGALMGISAIAASPASAALNFDWTFEAGGNTFAGKLLGVGDDGSFSGATSFLVTSAPGPFAGLAYTLGSDSLVFSGGLPTGGVATFTDYTAPILAGISLAGTSGASSAFSFNSSTPSIATFAGAPTTSFTPLVVAVPEASTWAMLIVGFGMIGAVLRKANRRSQSSNSPVGVGLAIA